VGFFLKFVLILLFPKENVGLSATSFGGVKV